MEDHDLLGSATSRATNAEKIGEKLYQKNWQKLKDALKELDPTFAQFVVEVPYGSVYPRDALNLDMREISAITALTQLNLKPQLKSHIIAARNLGITQNQIIELFLHIAMFIGFPLALDGLRVAKEVFDREEAKTNS